VVGYGSKSELERQPSAHRGSFSSEGYVRCIEKKVVKVQRTPSHGSHSLSVELNLDGVARLLLLLLL